MEAFRAAWVMSGHGLCFRGMLPLMLGKRTKAVVFGPPMPRRKPGQGWGHFVVRATLGPGYARRLHWPPVWVADALAEAAQAGARHRGAQTLEAVVVGRAVEAVAHQVPAMDMFQKVHGDMYRSAQWLDALAEAHSEMYDLAEKETKSMRLTAIAKVVDAANKARSKIVAGQQDSQRIALSAAIAWPKPRDMSG